MNPVLLAFIPGALIGLAVALLLLGIAPRSVRASDVLERLDAHYQATPADGAGPATGGRAGERAGSWLHTHMPDIPFLATPTRELDLLDVTPAAFYFRKLVYAVVGVLTPVALSLMLALIGSSTGGIGVPTIAFPLILSLILPLIFWFIPDQQVRTLAAARRREFTRFVTSYLELVAVALLGNTTADAALTAAANVSDSWVFERIRREYRIAETIRSSKWQALERLGETVGVPALGEMARVMRLSEAQVSVRDQLRAACDKLRAQVVTDDAVQAQRVSNLMQAPIFLTIFPIMALVLIPTALQFQGGGLTF